MITAAANNHGLGSVLDNVPPTVLIRAPSSTAGPLSGLIAMVGTASDNSAVTKVQIEIDDAPLGTAFGTANWTYFLDTTVIPNGQHTLTARAFDSQGNQGTYSVPITVSNQGYNTFVTSITASTTSTALPEWVGMQIRVGAAPVSVTALGRVYVPGNTGIHTLKLVDAATGIDLPNASAIVIMIAPAFSRFVYGHLPFPVTLAAGHSYYVVTQETVGGDALYDSPPTTVQTTTVASVLGSVAYRRGWIPAPGVNQTFGPVDIQYQGQASPPPPPPPSAPVITSATTATVQAGSAFAYTITATNSPTSFDATPLPASLTVNTSTGAIAGTPQTAGTFTIGLSATNAGGTGTANLILTVTAAPPPPPVKTAFVTSATGNPANLINSASSWVGMQFKVGAAPITVTSLGRFFVPGNNGLHTLKLVDAATGEDVPGTPVAVNMTPPSSGSFVYADLASPVILSAGHTYYLATLEFNGGDFLYETATVQTTGVANVLGPVSFRRSWSALFMPNQSAGPLDFKYLAQGSNVPPVINSPATATGVAGSGFTYNITATNSPTSFNATNLPAGLSVNTTTGNIFGVPQAAGTYTIGLSATNASGTGTGQLILTVTNVPPPPPPPGNHFVTSMNLAGLSLSNAQPAWTGMQLQVGASPVTVTALGRVYIAGNTGTHTLKLVDAATGDDVPNTSVSVIMTAPSGSQFVYADLPSPVTLTAGRTYYLVTQEFSGGDALYEFPVAVQTSSVASLLGPVTYRRSWSPVFGPNQTYGPVDFKYQAGGLSGAERRY